MSVEVAAKQYWNVIRRECEKVLEVWTFVDDVMIIVNKNNGVVRV